jgi:hypothetical protein
MNVDEASLRKYIETLHDTIRTVGAVVLEPNQAAQLLHNALLPAKITGYVSTQFGVAIEYAPATHTNIEIIRGSARVEDLVFHGPKQLRVLQPMLLAMGTGSSLSGGGAFVDGFPFRLATEACDFVVDNFNFEVQFLRWQRHIHYLEVFGNRSAALWTPESAASRAKDEVLAAVYLARQAAQQKTSLNEYVRRFRDKSVLVLGSYHPPGSARLESICVHLRELGYEPVLVANIPDFEHYDQSQKVVAIAAVSRFILIDDSDPSGHLNEVELCKVNRWVTTLLRANGKPASSMTLGASISSNVMHELPYDPEDMAPAVRAATAWAEQRLMELEKQFSAIYPFRNTSET